MEELCRLGVPVIDDIGSGALADGMPVLGEEPAVRRSVAAGAALVCFSGDKLLGGPQAGVLVGTEEAIGRARARTRWRAPMRIDKLSLAALEATLRLYREPRRARAEIPVLRMLAGPGGRAGGPRGRAGRRAARPRAWSAEVVRSTCAAGGGALPLLELEGPAVEVDPAPLAPDELARGCGWPILRCSCGCAAGRLLLEVRTLTDARSAAEAAAGPRGVAIADGA